MSTTLKVRTTQQRATEATSRLKRMIGADNLKLLSAAIAEVAADEADSNPAFVSRVRAVYQELVSMPTTRARSAASKLAEVELIPIGKVEGGGINPYAPLDPDYLSKLYGAHQLRAALSRYQLASLKDAAAKIQQEHPGTKPRNRSSKDSVIDYIVEHVAGPGY